MAKRKSGKELRKDYRDLLDKTKAMQKRIIKRAEGLIPQHPDVVYIKNNFPDGKPLTVGQYKNNYRIDPMIALNIIELIEQHIADQHPHQQQDLPFVKQHPDDIETTNGYEPGSTKWD